MARLVLDTESPIREDLLVRRVALAHGFQRAGANIRNRILDALGEVTATEEIPGKFLWSADSPPSAVSFRFTPVGHERRSLDEIAMQELIGLVRERTDLTTSDDPALAFAREIGLTRLARSARERLEEALEAVGQS